MLQKIKDALPFGTLPIYDVAVSEQTGAAAAGPADALMLRMHACMQLPSQEQLRMHACKNVTVFMRLTGSCAVCCSKSRPERGDTEDPWRPPRSQQVRPGRPRYAHLPSSTCARCMCLQGTLQVWSWGAG